MSSSLHLLPGYCVGLPKSFPSLSLVLLFCFVFLIPT